MFPPFLWSSLVSGDHKRAATDGKLKVPWLHVKLEKQTVLLLADFNAVRKLGELLSLCYKYCFLKKVFILPYLQDSDG